MILNVRTLWLFAPLLSGCHDDASGDSSSGEDSGSETSLGETGGSSVTDTSDSSGTGDGDGDPMESAYIFDQDEVRHYDIRMDPADWEWLKANARLEEYREGSLDFEGDTWDSVGVRFKGGYGSLESCFDLQGQLTCNKLSLKLDFAEYLPEQKFYELKKLNFHSMNSDPTKLKDRVGYALFNEFGVVAPRAVHATVSVNGESQGLYVLVEQVDGRFSRDRFPSDGEGNVYKEVWPMHTVAQPYLDALETNADENPSVEKMISFAEQITAAGPDGLAEVVDARMDRAMFGRLLAVDRAIENWDGIFGWWCVGDGCGNHNYYWYEHTLTDQMVLVPWDLDHTFDVPNFLTEDFGEPRWLEDPVDCVPVPIFWPVGRRAARCDPIIDGMVVSLWPDYVSASEELLGTLFSEEEMMDRIDFYEAQIAEHVAADPTLDGLDWPTQVQVLRDSVVALGVQVEADITP